MPKCASIAPFSDHQSSCQGHAAVWGLESRPSTLCRLEFGASVNHVVDVAIADDSHCERLRCPTVSGIGRLREPPLIAGALGCVAYPSVADVGV